MSVITSRDTIGITTKKTPKVLPQETNPTSATKNSTQCIAWIPKETNHNELITDGEAAMYDIISKIYLAALLGDPELQCSDLEFS